MLTELKCLVWKPKTKTQRSKSFQAKKVRISMVSRCRHSGFLGKNVPVWMALNGCCRPFGLGEQTIKII